MNHPSEWTKFFDELTGRYRNKHKGSGVVRDTLLAIGKVFKSGAKALPKRLRKSPKSTKILVRKPWKRGVT